jgi:ATP-dependent Clp protease ATP-binding subunit ClpA
VFERFTDGAREAVGMAQAEASALRHGWLGTEHLLLGVSRVRPSVSARVLRALGLGPEDVRAAIVREIGRGPLSDRDAEALSALGIDLEEVRERVEETFGPGALDRPVRPGGRRRSCGWEFGHGGRLAFTPRAKKALELSLREARHLGHNYVGTEHILLGLAREGEGVAAQILSEAGATFDRLRRAVIEELARGIEPPGASA